MLFVVSGPQLFSNRHRDSKHGQFRHEAGAPSITAGFHVEVAEVIRMQALGIEAFVLIFRNRRIVLLSNALKICRRPNYACAVAATSQSTCILGRPRLF